MAGREPTRVSAALVRYWRPALALATLVIAAGVALVLGGSVDLSRLAACAVCGADGDLAIQMSGPASVPAGGQVVIDIAAQNRGPTEKAADTVITITTQKIDASAIRVTSASEYKVQQLKGGLSIYVGQLLPASETWIQLSFTAPPASMTAPITASIAAAAPIDPNQSNNTASLTVTVIGPPPPPQADLSVRQDIYNLAPGPSVRVLAGTRATYYANVANAGPDRATNVVLRDTVPAGVTLTGFNTACTFASGVLTCTVASLAAGTGTSFGFEFIAPASGTLTNMISASATEMDPNASNNALSTTTDITPSTDLAAALSAAVSADPSASGAYFITYTFTATNNGPSVSTDAIATFVLTTGQTFSSISSPNAYAPNGVPFCDPTTLQCRFNPIPAGGTATMTVVVRVRGGFFSNHASVTAGPLDYDPVTTNDNAPLSVNVP